MFSKYHSTLNVATATLWHLYITTKHHYQSEKLLTEVFNTLATHVQASLSDGQPRDLLDALLIGQTDSGQVQKSNGPEDEGITDDHVLMTAAEAFGAGVETTSTTLLWILAYLLHHPEVKLLPQL